MYPDASPDLLAHRDWLLSFVDLPEGGTAVDLGCGTGGDLLALAARHADPSARFSGIDAAETAIAARRRHRSAQPGGRYFYSITGYAYVARRRYGDP